MSNPQEYATTRLKDLQPATIEWLLMFTLGNSEGNGAYEEGRGGESPALSHYEPSLTSTISSATLPCASRCTASAASAFGASNRQ